MFDIMYISVLVDIEKKISLRGKIESSYPEIKSFFRGKKCIVQCAIIALCKLICPETSEKTLPCLRNLIYLLKIRS